MSKPFTASDDVVPGEAYQAGYHEGYNDALADYDNALADRVAIIEECVRAAQQWLIRAEQGSGEDLIDAIRALKE